jgi:Domain of unknown function (DUF4177)
MQKWEYKMLSFSEYAFRYGSLPPEFNKLGADGWELVSMVEGVDGDIKSVFKRAFS